MTTDKPDVTRVIDAKDTRFGGYLEDYQPGDLFKHWPGKTVTEADDHLFCLLTLSLSPLHTDAEYAKNHMPEGKNIVIGTYIYSLVAGMSVPDISGRAIANLGVKELKHVAPVYHGDTIYAETLVLATRNSNSRPDAGILTVETRGVNQNGTLVCQFERSVMLPRRPQ